MHLRDVVQRPIYLVKSGPAMAPVAGLAYVEAEHLPRDVIVCDAGGTTFDVSLVRDGAIEFSRDTWLGPRWVGDDLGMASVAVHSIGAGGGSIAWIDSGGLLRVGPHSAGADPGPACYGRGGEQATVTDAAVVLGYIDPQYFLGGRMQLDEAAAQRVVEGIGQKLGLTVERAAYAIMAVANENMIQAIKELTINEGLDPSESVLIGGGGAGGLNIVPIAAELGCRTVLVPQTAGALSASGMQFSDIITEAGASRLTASDNFDFAGVNAALAGIDERLQAFGAELRARGFDEMRTLYFVEARYRFQVWELEIQVPGNRFNGPADVETLVQEFHRVHERVFAIRDEGQVVECLNWRGRLIATVRAASLAPARTLAGVNADAHRRRGAYFGRERLDTPVFLGAQLPPRAVIDGPAIIEEPTSTLVVYPGTTARVSDGSRYILTPLQEQTHMNRRTNHFHDGHARRSVDGCALQSPQLDRPRDGRHAASRRALGGARRGARFLVFAGHGRRPPAVPGRGCCPCTSSAAACRRNRCASASGYRPGRRLPGQRSLRPATRTRPSLCTWSVFMDGGDVFTAWPKLAEADCGNSIPSTYHAYAHDVYEEGALIFPCVRVQKRLRGRQRHHPHVPSVAPRARTVVRRLPRHRSARRASASST